jgi:hypothetical protein
MKPDAGSNWTEGYYDPPSQLVVPSSEMRLIWPLRAAARIKPETMLSLSAAAFALAGQPAINLSGPPPAEPPFPPVNARPADILRGGIAIVGGARAMLAQAFADFSVSGRAAYDEFRHSPPKAETIAQNARGLLAQVAGLDANAVVNGAQSALRRANAVANCLDAIIPDSNLRRALGYIALSGRTTRPAVRSTSRHCRIRNTIC